MKKVIAAILLVLIASSVTAANTQSPTVGQLQITPEHPIPKATVTYSITLAENASEVNLWYHECRVAPNAICYQAQNVSMTGSGKQFQKQVTLGHSDATYVVARAYAKIGNAWVQQGQDFNVTLNTQQQNNTNNNTKKGTPGFEIVPVLAAVGIALFLMRKKRS